MASKLSLKSEKNGVGVDKVAAALGIEPKSKEEIISQKMATSSREKELYDRQRDMIVDYGLGSEKRYKLSPFEEELTNIIEGYATKAELGELEFHMDPACKSILKNILGIGFEELPKEDEGIFARIYTLIKSIIGIDNSKKLGTLYNEIKNNKRFSNKQKKNKYNSNYSTIISQLESISIELINSILEGLNEYEGQELIANIKIQQGMPQHLQRSISLPTNFFIRVLGESVKLDTKTLEFILLYLSFNDPTSQTGALSRTLFSNKRPIGTELTIDRTLEDDPEFESIITMAQIVICLLTIISIVPNFDSYISSGYTFYAAITQELIKQGISLNLETGSFIIAGKDNFYEFSKLTNLNLDKIFPKIKTSKGGKSKKRKLPKRKSIKKPKRKTNKRKQKK